MPGLKSIGFIQFVVFYDIPMSFNVSATGTPPPPPALQEKMNRNNVIGQNTCFFITFLGQKSFGIEPIPHQEKFRTKVFEGLPNQRPLIISVVLTSYNRSSFNPSNTLYEVKHEVIGIL